MVHAVLPQGACGAAGASPEIKRQDLERSVFSTLDNDMVVLSRIHGEAEPVTFAVYGAHPSQELLLVELVAVPRARSAARGATRASQVIPRELLKRAVQAADDRHRLLDADGLDLGVIVALAVLDFKPLNQHLSRDAQLCTRLRDRALAHLPTAARAAASFDVVLGLLQERAVRDSEWWLLPPCRHSRNRHTCSARHIACARARSTPAPYNDASPGHLKAFYDRVF